MGNKKNENKNGMMEVVFILDRSGSMSGMEADTIGGFNAMLQKQKDESDKIVWSTVLFDHDHEVIHNRVPIQKVEPLNDKQYYVRGTTALLDAVGRAIHHIAMCHKYAKPEDVPEKTLFIITTDGMENASRQYSYRKVKQMIELEQERYGWEFLFLGANIDAPQFAGRIGICADRSATYINDEEGIEKNFTAFSHTVAKMARMEAFEPSDLDEIRADFKKRGGRH